MIEKLGSRKTGTWLVAAICATLAMGVSADDFGGTASTPSATDLPITVAAPAPNQSAYVTGQFQMGGVFLDNPPYWPAMRSPPGEAWWVPAEAPSGEGSLFIVLDRSLLPKDQDLTLELSLFDKEGSSLYVDLLATNYVTVGTNLYGNLIEGTNEIVCVELPIALSEYPEAAIIRLWRGVGEVLVYESELRLMANQASVSGSVEPSVQGEAGIPAGEMDVQPDVSLSKAECQPADSDTQEFPASSLPITNAVPPTGIPQVQQPVPENHTIYVDQKVGNDNYTGRVDVRRSQDGPKKTVDKGVLAAEASGDVVIKSGTYTENIDIAGRDVHVRIEGKVILGDNNRPVPVSPSGSAPESIPTGMGPTVVTNVIELLNTP